MATIRLARFGGEGDDADLCRTLMREYALFLNDSVGGEHICVESLEEELAGLPQLSGNILVPVGNSFGKRPQYVVEVGQGALERL